MPRMLEIKSGLNLTVAGPARVIVYGKPTLTGTQVEPAQDSGTESLPPTGSVEHANHSAKANHKTKK